MIQPVLPLILASGSPRRRELMDLMGLTYTCLLYTSSRHEEQTGGLKNLGLFL